MHLILIFNQALEQQLYQALNYCVHPHISGLLKSSNILFAVGDPFDKMHAKVRSSCVLYNHVPMKLRLFLWRDCPGEGSL